MAQNRYYSSDAQQTTLAVALGSVAPGTTGQTVEVEAITDWPTQYPFTILIDWGDTDQEVCTVTQAAAGSGPYTFANCVRGDDGSLSPAHDEGATVTHGVSARDFSEPQEHINGFTQGMAPSGLTGATVATRYVGGVTGAHPTTGTFETGDWVADTDGGFWVCTAGGTPGTWVEVSGSGGEGSGTVTSVAVETANGFAGTVADDTTTPQITLETTVAAGLLKSTGSALAAAEAGTDYLTPTGSGADLTGITAEQVGAAALDGATFTGPVSPAASDLTAGATIAVDASLGNDFPVTLTENATIDAPSNPVAWQTIRFHLTQGTGGSFTVTWTSGTGGYSFGSGSTPTLSTAAGDVDKVGFQYDPNLELWCYMGSALGFAAA